MRRCKHISSTKCLRSLWHSKAHHRTAPVDHTPLRLAALPGVSYSTLAARPSQSHTASPSTSDATPRSIASILCPVQVEQASANDVVCPNALGLTDADILSSISMVRAPCGHAEPPSLTLFSQSTPRQQPIRRYLSYASAPIPTSPLPFMQNSIVSPAKVKYAASRVTKLTLNGKILQPEIAGPSATWRCMHCDYIQTNRLLASLKHHIASCSSTSVRACCLSTLGHTAPPTSPTS